ncbi:BTB/POZ domain-containing protein KCTD4-like [Haliotis asinina]|uniref:BTB/POZ domain-containing protein KCTD4-like n=1 Tax=Haliotis asinina TaxID=109174 RepID=UPI003531C22A
MSRSNDKVMRLNVGGTFYTTLRSTLSLHQGTVLWRIATGNQYCYRDDRGFFVIDRDGHVFRHVLNYLRTSKLLLPQGFRELDLLREDAVYYGINNLVRDIDALLEKKKKKRPPQAGNRGGRMRRMSASVGDNLHQLDEDEIGLGYFEDSWIDGNTF